MTLGRFPKGQKIQADSVLLDARIDFSRPAVHPTEHIPYFFVAPLQQESRSIFASPTGSADDHDISILRDLAEPGAEFVKGNVDYVLEAADLEFVCLADIEKEQWIDALKRLLERLEGDFILGVEWHAAILT